MQECEQPTYFMTVDFTLGLLQMADFFYNRVK